MPRVTAPTSRPKTRVSATIAQIGVDVGTDDRTARVAISQASTAPNTTTAPETACMERS